VIRKQRSDRLALAVERFASRLVGCDSNTRRRGYRKLDPGCDAWGVVTENPDLGLRGRAGYG
jgi:hypothetical protein